MNISLVGVVYDYWFPETFPPQFDVTSQQYLSPSTYFYPPQPVIDPYYAPPPLIYTEPEVVSSPNWSSPQQNPPRSYPNNVSHNNSKVPVASSVPRTPYILINSVEQCRAIVEKLLPYTKLAIDIEGIALSRTGRICVIQIATTTDVYLFDIEVLKEAAFEEGRLKELLESPTIDKLFFDARKDAEALYYQYQVQLTNVFDLQILYCKYRQSNKRDSSRFLPGLKTCFQDTQLFTKKESQRYENIKKKGHELFSPMLGGQFEAWAQRPLHPDLITYCIYDVMLLHSIFSKCCHLLKHEQLLALSERRIQEIVESEQEFAENDLIWRTINF